MLTKLIAGLVVTFALVTGGGATWKALSPDCHGTKASNCCFEGSDCCYPGSPCCDDDCCASGAACCNPPSACCTAAKAQAKASDCCASGGACCDAGQDCCLGATQSK